MGRKIDMKKIDDITKCQVTFSKRRSSMMKKANEIAVCCDVDVAFVAFSPSGRVSKFCSQRRIEDVLFRYVNLPADKRLNHISNVEEKMEKLRQLGHINGDTSKLQYLDKQLDDNSVSNYNNLLVMYFKYFCVIRPLAYTDIRIENLELQIKKSGLELQILETDLRDFELGPEQESSLHQLSWCERNLNHSLQRVIARKMDLIKLENQTRTPFSSTFNENGQVSTIENPIPGQILMQLDPWISPYSARVRESIFQDLFDQTKYTTNVNVGPLNTPNFSIPSNISNFSIQESATIFASEIMLTSNVQVPTPHIPLEQPLMVDQPLLNFHGQNNVNAWNNNTSSVVFSDAIHLSTQSLCNFQVPRFRSITTTVIPNPSREEMPQPLYDGMGIGLQCTNSNLNQFSNMEGQETGVQLNNSSFINGNTRNDRVEHEDYSRINCDQIQKCDQSQDAYNVQLPKEVCQDAQYDNLLQEDTHGDNTLWTSKIQKSGLWEWEDLLLDQNFNFQDFT